MSIYVERTIDSDVERLWALTQTPEMHERWDLRFSSIRYLPREKPEDPQAFEYQTRLGFGLSIYGTGKTIGDHHSDDGASSSALVFSSQDRLSLIRKGSGFWRYTPAESERTQFVTGYDYTVRWGKLGWLVDRALFRPLMAWATAWSFDRLARWAEKGVMPEASLRISLAYTILRLTVAGVWLYEGIFPKLLGPHPQELALSIRAGIPAAWAWAFVKSLGVLEVLLGILIVGLWHRKWPLLVSALAMMPALLLGMKAAPELVTAPFNVVVINAMTAALSVAAIVLMPDVVSASACKWRVF